MIFKLNNATVGYSNSKLIANCNVAINEGEIVGLYGVNGSGKSTLIKSICNLHRFVSGTIKWNVEDNLSFDLSQQIALVNTERFSTLQLDVFSVVALGRIPYLDWTGKLGSIDFQAIEEAIDQTQIRDYLWRDVQSLSDGERQRVMIARALAQDTPLIIMDEPTAFLDVIQRKKLVELIRTIRTTRNKSFIISTHELHLLEGLQDQAWIIHNHQLQICKSEIEFKQQIKETFYEI